MRDSVRLGVLDRVVESDHSNVTGMALPSFLFWVKTIMSQTSRIKDNFARTPAKSEVPPLNYTFYNTATKPYISLLSIVLIPTF